MNRKELEKIKAEIGNVPETAFANLMRLSQMFAGIMLIADDIAHLGSLEAATRDVSQRIEKRKAEERKQANEIDRNIGEHRGRAEAAEREAEDRIAEAENNTKVALRELHEQEAQAKAMVEAARSQADAIVQSARNQSEKLIIEARAAAAKHGGAIGDMTEHIKSLDKMIESRQDVLDSINHQLEKLRKQL